MLKTPDFSDIVSRPRNNITFADGSTLAFYGYLKNFEPQDSEEGSDPEANITIQPTNWDNANSTEEAPVLVAVPGT